jgi:hypothetical protein
MKTLSILPFSPWRYAASRIEMISPLLFLATKNPRETMPEVFHHIDIGFAP